VSQLEHKINTESKAESQKGLQDLYLANCEDCGCLIHIDVYNLHKADKICKNGGVCGTCWKKYYDVYIQQGDGK